MFAGLVAILIATVPVLYFTSYFTVYALINTFNLDKISWKETHDYHKETVGFLTFLFVILFLMFFLYWNKII